MTVAFAHATREAVPDARAIGNGRRRIHGCFYRPHYRLRKRRLFDILAGSIHAVSLSTLDPVTGVNYARSEARLARD